LKAGRKPRSRLADDAAAALWRSAGFTVDAPEGRVGIVEDAVRIPGLKRPAALAVRIGAHGERVVLVPVTEIVRVDTESRTITLHEAPK